MSAPVSTTTTPLSAAHWDDARFDAARRAVLAGWRTGAEVDFAEAVQFHASRPELNNVPRKRAWARATGNVLVQPLAGVTSWAGHNELMHYLQDKGEADILPSQIDSQTRTLQFAAAQQALEQSAPGAEKLNGYPIVNHGVAATRRIVASLDVPIEMRIGTVHPQLPAEIAFAAGMSSMPAGPIYYNVHYARDASFEAAIENWQYVFRLIGRYREHGARIGLQIHGIGNSTPFPNTLLGACGILEILIAAAQGARDFSIDNRMMGSMVQDAASIRAIREAALAWTARCGYPDVNININRKNWSGRYPEDVARAYGLICYNAVSGLLGGCNEFIANSVQEGVGIPLKEANADTLRAIRQVIGMMQGQRVGLDPAGMAEEIALMKLEIDAILEAVLDAGDGDAALGTVRAFASGVLDIPFAATRQCRGEMMVARDAEGAVRYLDAGRVPVPAAVLRHHKACLDRRAAARGGPIDYNAIVDDIFSISRGYLVGR